MIKRIVALIPARKGSKRLPGKNKKKLCGKRLIDWTIDEALKCEFIDEIIVSTDDEILGSFVESKYEDKLNYVRRPSYLASDDTPMWGVVEHALQDYPDDTVVILLQPTSPLRTEFDIRCCYRLFQLYREQSGVISVYWEYPNKHMVINGAIYLHYLSTIVNTRSFVQNGIIVYNMPKDRSVDVDTIEDFKEAERLMKKRVDDAEN